MNASAADASAVNASAVDASAVNAGAVDASAVDIAAILGDFLVLNICFDVLWQHRHVFHRHFWLLDLNTCKDSCWHFW